MQALLSSVLLGVSKRGCAHATVEFVARHKQSGRAERLHEISGFVREEGRWFYVDGELR